MVNFKKQSILDMFNMYPHKIQQNLIQTVKLHEIIVKNKVTPTLWKIVVFNEIYSKKKFGN
jgi:hypothetical protein